MHVGGRHAAAAHAVHARHSVQDGMDQRGFHGAADAGCKDPGGLEQSCRHRCAPDNCQSGKAVACGSRRKRHISSVLQQARSLLWGAVRRRPPADASAGGGMGGLHIARQADGARTKA
jgi:hypothetical protein